MAKGLDTFGRTIYLDDEAFTADVDLGTQAPAPASGSALSIIVTGWSLTASGGAAACQMALRDGAAGNRLAGARVGQNVPWVVDNVRIKLTKETKLVLAGGLAATTVSGFIKFEVG